MVTPEFLNMKTESEFCKCVQTRLMSMNLDNNNYICGVCSKPLKFFTLEEPKCTCNHSNDKSSTKDTRPLTIFCDIDGCIFEHDGTPNNHLNKNPKLLPGVKEKLNSWKMKDYRLILTTGRKECTRDDTVRQLKEAGLDWDQLIMGLGGGFRVLINDFKPGNPDPTALAFTVERNKGLGDIKI